LERIRINSASGHRAKAGARIIVASFRFASFANQAPAFDVVEALGVIAARQDVTALGAPAHPYVMTMAF
jgi:hypothetical protein